MLRKYESKEPFKVWFAILVVKRGQKQLYVDEMMRLNASQSMPEASSLADQ